MNLVADDDLDLRRAEEAATLDVPAGPQHRVPGRGQAGEVRHLRPRREADARVRRQPEQVERPPRRDLLGGGGRRRADLQAGHLVPGGHEPVGAEGDRQRPAGDEAEYRGPADATIPGSASAASCSMTVRGSSPSSVSARRSAGASRPPTGRSGSPSRNSRASAYARPRTSSPTTAPPYRPRSSCTRNYIGYHVLKRRDEGGCDEARRTAPHHDDHGRRPARTSTSTPTRSGLRMVKKTVNFDQPERLPPVLRRRAGRARLDPHLVRVRRRRAPARPASAMIHTLQLGVAVRRRARLLGRAARRPRRRERPRRRPPALRRSRRPRARARRRRRRQPAAARRASRRPRRARDHRHRGRARLQRVRRRSRRSC